MIQALRQRHRTLISALALTLPAVFASGLLVRQPVPATGNLPTAPARLMPGDGRIAPSERSGLPESPFAVRLLPGTGSAVGAVIELLTTRELSAPDVLIYWSAAEPEAGRLPAEATLLGPLKGARGARFAVPERAAPAGRLILYSLARQEVVATLQIPTSPTKGDAP
jgi:hypothetical protein